MYVNSKFTDKKEVTYQDYNDYVFRSPSGKTPYGNTVWSGLASNKYLTHGNLINTDGKGNSVGFHKVSGATHDSMETNRLVPAVWHTAINPYVILSGYTKGGGILTIYNDNLDPNVQFQYISHWQFKFRDGAQYRCDVLSGYLSGAIGDTIDLTEIDTDSANWYSGNTSVSLSKVSAHGDLSSVTYTGYDITKDSTHGTAVTSYEVTEESASIWVKRGVKDKWYRASEGTPIVFGNAGITTTDILNFNASGQSKYDFHIFVSFEPDITLWMAEPETFSFFWTWEVVFNTPPSISHQIQLRLKNTNVTGGTIYYTTETVTVSATTSGFVTKKIPKRYSGHTFTLDCLSEIIDDGAYTIASTAATFTTLTTAFTTTTLYLNKT